MASTSTPITVSTSGKIEESKNYISTLTTTRAKDFSIAEALSDEAIKQIKEMFNAKPMIEYACHNCGAKLQLDHDDHIFKCKYCGSVYMVGLDQVNSGR